MNIRRDREGGGEESREQDGSSTVFARGRERFFHWSGTLTVAVALALVTILSGAAVGAGFAVKVGDVRATFGVGVGNRDAMSNAMPWYAKNQIGADSPYVSQSFLAKFGIIEVVEALAIDKNLQIPDSALDLKIAGK
ncbi:MAG: hypothetical protein Q7S44_01010 [bacterium]|nr:hypothetical protein [bacterium]